MSGAMSTQPRRNKSLERGLALLKSLADHPDGATVPELAEETALPRTTAARLLATLDALGAVTRQDSRRWTLGPEITRLGSAADPFTALRSRARSVVRAVSAELEESTMIIAVNEAWEMETILQSDAATLVGATDWRGRRESGVLHAGAAGKLALAALSDQEALTVADPLTPITPRTITVENELRDELDRVRRQGWASTVDELEVGLTAIAVPLHYSTVTGHGLSLSVSGPSARLPTDRHQEAATLLARAADSIERAGEGAATGRA
jgi:DNA-binding IclR family transcriptional regulator